MNNDDYEQYELTAEQVGDDWKFLKEGCDCQMVVFNNNPIAVTPPTTSSCKSNTAEPAAKGQHGHQRSETGEVGNGRRDLAPAFINTATGCASTRVRANISNGRKARR